MTCRHLQFTTALLVVTLALASQSIAQEQEDGHSVRSTRLGLLVPHETRREKRRAAKAGGWAWTFAGSAAAGYDSNLHLAPGNEVNSRVVDSGVFEAALRAEVLHYFNRDSRLELRAEANAVPYTETTEVNDYNQKVSAFYGQRLSENFKFLLSADISHKNDNATFINGEQLDRDFESWNYQARPTLSYRFHSDHKLRIQYRVKYKDYVETPSLNSLDWLSHGPKVYYDWDVLDKVEIELSYAFKSQNYDEEIASLSDGTETLSNPDERHFFHDLQAGVSWEAFDWLKLNVTGGFKRKDDQYRDFESYNSQNGARSVHGERRHQVSTSRLRQSPERYYREAYVRPGRLRTGRPNAVDSEHWRVCRLRSPLARYEQKCWHLVSQLHRPSSHDGRGVGALKVQPFAVGSQS
jgi:hypothetical protein